MKTLFVVILICLATVATRAQLLLSDGFNYTNGPIEGQGGWSVYETYAATTNNDAFVTNNLLILNQAGNDSVATSFTNNTAPSLVYASFTINVSTLPSAKGGFFCVLMDSNSPANTSTDEVCRIFIDTTNAVVPGTYRVGIANFATSITAFGATNFPMDLATGVTYQVVLNWDETSAAQGGTLWVNPSSAGDLYVYGNDVTNQPLESLQVSRIGFSQYAGQGVAGIGNVRVGLGFSDVMTNVPQIPVLGVQPQGTAGTIYAGNSYTLYTAASGMDVTYQWYSNNVALADNGVTIVGSTANILNLTNLQNTASYTVVVSDSAGSVTSTPAVLSINSTPTSPLFTVQPQNQTNSDLSPVTLTAQASGTGPITYQWFFQSANTTGFSALSGQTGSTLSFTGGYANSGSYYVTAANGISSQNSTTVYLLIIPPPLISIATLKSYIVDANSSTSINAGQIFNVEGVVTTFGDILSGGTSEFYIQDGTGACLVYRAGIGSSNTPPVGALVQVISPAQSYYGAVEMNPGTGAATNGVFILSTNNPLPATIPLNMAQMVTNDPAVINSYGWVNENSIATMTNIYLYSSAAGAAVSGNFPTNSSKTLYAYQLPYAQAIAAGQTNIPVYVYTYTNVLNRLNTNYWGKPIPGFCYQLNGINGVYSAAVNGARFYPSRYADFVTTLPASFPAGVTVTNGAPVVSWPAVAGSTYSVYSSTNLLGPWTQTFGLSYYPSTGTYADTNSAGAKFYKVSTP